MKKILLVIGLSLGFSSLQAQYWQLPNISAGQNPGGLNTDVEEPLAGVTGWTSIQAASATAVWTAAQTLPFAFQFNGSAVTQYKVSSTGVLTFDVASPLAAPSATNLALPNAAIPNNSICVWGVNCTGANDNIVTKTFGTAPNRQYWVQFSSCSNVANANIFAYWAIVFDETTNKIHIVDQRTAATSGVTAIAITAGIQFTSTSAISVAGSPSLGSTTGTTGGSDDTPIDNTYYTFTPGVQPAYDMSVNSITNQQFVPIGNNSITGTIRNYGANTITSFSLNYKVDAGATVTSTINSVSIPTGSTYSFTHPTPWNATIGTHTVDVWATNLNGSNVDADLTNDHKTKSISVLSENVQRVPLFEVFTSSTCPPCNPGNTNYHLIVDTKPAGDYVTIKYQQDFPGTGDPYATTEAVNRRNTPYAINSIPRMEIDGGWDGNAQSFTDALYTAERALPAQYKMQGTFNVSNMSVTAKVKFSPLFNGTGAKLYVAILERETVQNVKSNGETKFFEVMKKMLPTETGTALPTVTIGNWDSLSFNYTFKGNYRLPIDGLTANVINHTIEHSVEHFYNTNVVAWIQAADKTVYQAINLTSLTPNSTQDFSASMSTIDVYPNPANDRINIGIELKSNDEILATLIDALGHVIESKSVNMQEGKNTMSFTTNNLASGVYNVMLFDSKNNSSVHQVIVQH